MSKSEMPQRTDVAVAAMTVVAAEVNVGSSSQVYTISTTRMRPQAVVGADAASDVGGMHAQCQCGHGETASTASYEAGGNVRGKNRVILGWDRLRTVMLIGLIVMLVIWAAIFFPLNAD